MYVGDIVPVFSQAIVTIRGKSNKPSVIGTVQWSWKDDNGKLHIHLVKNVIFFPDSPVHILSITSFANKLNDYDGTSIHTFHWKSIFHWDNKQVQCTIIHPESNHPWIAINEGFKLSLLQSSIVSASVILSKHNYHCSLFSTIPDKDYNVTTQNSDALN